MALDHRQAFCNQCARLVRAERKATNHILHLLLSIVTLGLWLPLWILASIKIGGWRCPNCGGTDLQRGTPKDGQAPNSFGAATPTGTAPPSDLHAPQPAAAVAQAGSSRRIAGALKTLAISAVLGVGAVVVLAVFVAGPHSAPTSPQPPRAALAVPEEGRDFAKISCKEFSQRFGIHSNLSDLQKDAAFADYKDKWVRWTGTVTEISSTFGSPSLQVKCLPETFVSDAIISFPRSETDSLLRFSKGSTITFEAKLEAWGALVPHRLGEGRLANS